ncbi:hypothetical protein FCV43_14750, partial [Vibrio genomosp. F6]
YYPYKHLRVTPNAWRVYSDLKFVFTVQWFSLGVIALSHLNWALYDVRCEKSLHIIFLCLTMRLIVCGNISLTL